MYPGFLLQVKEEANDDSCIPPGLSVHLNGGNFEQYRQLNCLTSMKESIKISTILRRIMVVIIFIISQFSVIFAQEPTHYPDANEPIPPTLINILIYLGGPILLFVIYYNFRKREKKKKEAKMGIKDKADNETKA